MLNYNIISVKITLLLSGYSRACDSSQDFLDIWLLLTRNLLNQMFILAKLKWTLLRSPPWLGWPLWNICINNDLGNVSLVVKTSVCFPHSWLITGFVTRLTRQVSLEEHELLNLPEHMSSSSVFSVVPVTRSLVLCVVYELVDFIIEEIYQINSI